MCSIDPQSCQVQLEVEVLKMLTTEPGLAAESEKKFAKNKIYALLLAWPLMGLNSATYRS